MRKLIFGMAFALMSSGFVYAKPKANVQAPIEPMLDLSTPEGKVSLLKKIQCGPEDGKPAVFHWSGNAYSYVDGEAQKLLFKVEGMNIRQCTTITDPKRGTGFRLVSREIMLYLDPESSQILRNWKNPWTNETVEVMHVNNDPVNSRPTFPFDSEGKPLKANIKVEDRSIQVPVEAPLFYNNPLNGEFQDYVGGKYQAMEIFDFSTDKKEALLEKSKSINPDIAWVRIADWLPWMKMQGRQGKMVVNATGTKISGFDALPAILKNEIKENFPIYESAPPVDDGRPNATTWTVFKAKIQAQKQPK